MRTLVAQDEAGAVAILYALTLLIMIGFAALVLDIGALRNDRRAAQTTADFASVAAVSNLGEGVGGSPQRACRDALRYFSLNTPSVDLSAQDVQDRCNATGFPETDEACWDGTIDNEITEPIHIEPYLVRLTWPVDLDSEGYSDELDGDRCERFSVQISRTRDFVFGRALDVDETGETGARATARAIVGEGGEEVVNLLILDKTGCGAIRAHGNANLRLMSSALRYDEEGNVDPAGEHIRGRAAVDSEGSGRGGAKCGNNDYTIEVHGGAWIRAEGEPINPTSPPAEPRPGRITLYALPPGVVGCPEDTKACNDDDIAESYDLGEGGIWPEPRVQPDRTNRTPADHRYNCRKAGEGGISDGFYVLDGAPSSPHEEWSVPPCPSGSTNDNWIDQERSRFGSAHPNLGQPTGFTRWSDEYDCGNFNEPGTVTVPEGNWWVDCHGPGGANSRLNVQSPLHFEGGTIVFADRLSISSDVRFNHDGSSLSLDPGADNCGEQANRAETLIYFGQGGYAQSATGSNLVLCNTTTILNDGRIDVQGGNFIWTAPREDGLPFQNLALWSEGYAENFLAGGGFIELDGVFFTPNATTRVSGGGTGHPREAQFFTWRLRTSGSSTVVLSPNPERHLPTPAFEGAALIR